jgi:D-alanine-D-alanine ligase
MTKRVIRDAGIPTSDFQVVASDRDIDAIQFGPPYFVKPVAEGTGKGTSPDSIISDRSQLKESCRRCVTVYRQPALVEPYLSGREFTVGILGTGDTAVALGTVEVHLNDTAEPGVYSYVNKEKCEELVVYRLARAHEDKIVAQAEAISLAAWRVLGCRDAGRIDIRCDESGRPLFMEVNPLAGIHPEHSDLPIICNQLGIPYVTLIEKIIASASIRRRSKGA